MAGSQVKNNRWQIHGRLFFGRQIVCPSNKFTKNAETMEQSQPQIIYSYYFGSSLAISL